MNIWIPPQYFRKKLKNTTQHRKNTRRYVDIKCPHKIISIQNVVGFSAKKIYIAAQTTEIGQHFCHHNAREN